jgi:hypothetical protein
MPEALGISGKHMVAAINIGLQSRPQEIEVIDR